VSAAKALVVIFEIWDGFPAGKTN